ncbi:MAG: caspase family protein [Bacteroidetes bacterium]|nr:caspase family protein [Bacteroidota bacterium]
MNFFKNIFFIALLIIMHAAGSFLTAQSGNNFTLAIQSGHSGTVRNIAVHGNVMISTTKPSDTKLWDTRSGLELVTFPTTMTTYEGNAAINADESEAAISGDKIQTVDIQSNTVTAEFSGSKEPLIKSGVAYSPVSLEYLITAEQTKSDVKNTKVFLFEKKQYASPEEKNSVKGNFQKLCVSKDGKFAAVCTYDNVAVFKIPSLKKLFEIPLNSFDAVFSADSKMLYVASPNGWQSDNVRDKYYRTPGVYCIDVNKEEIVRNVELSSLNSPRAISLHPSEKQLAVATNGGSLANIGQRNITIFNLPDFTELKSFSVDKNNNACFSLAYTTDGKTLITGSASGEISFLSTLNWLPLRQTGSNSLQKGFIRFFADEGKKLVIQKSNTLFAWDLVKGEVAYSIVHNASLKDDYTTLFACVINPSHTRIVTGASDGELKVWNAETGAMISGMPVRLPSKITTYVIPKYFVNDSVVKIEIGTKGSYGDDRYYGGYNLKTKTVSRLLEEKFVMTPKKDYAFVVGYEKNKIDPYDYGKDIVTLYKKGEEGAAPVELKKFDYATKESKFDGTGNYLMLSYNFYAANRQNVKLGDWGEVWDVKKNASLLKFGEGFGEFSPGGKYFCYQKFGGQSSVIYQLPEWKILATLKFQSKQSGGMFSPDDKTIAFTGDDGAVYLYDVASGKPIASMVLVGTDIYAVVNAQGYYKASRKAYSAIAFRNGLQAYPFEQFDLRFNRPAEVLRSLGKADKQLLESYREAYKKRLQRYGFTEAQFQNSYTLPEAVITSTLPLSVSERKFSFSVEASEKAGTLDRLNVTINGVPLNGIRGQSLKDKALKQWSGSVEVLLNQGLNTIQVSAVNNQGIESLQQIFKITCTAQFVKPTLYFVAVGVSLYKDSQYNLTYAAKDASDMLSMFQQAKNTYAEVKTVNLSNAEATRENIMKTKDLLLHSNVDDEVIFFYAGHGLLDDSLNYYLATYDVDFSRPQQRGLRIEEAENLLDGIPARNKIIFIDACNSGEVDKEESVLADVSVQAQGNVTSRGFKTVKSRESHIGLSNSFELMKELFADLRNNNGAVVISSASGKEFAFESSEWKNGVFTYSILEGLKNNTCDVNKDRNISVSELRDYVGKRVQELTNGKQNPTSRAENLENDFRVW